MKHCEVENSWFLNNTEQNETNLQQNESQEHINFKNHLNVGTALKWNI